MRAQGGRDIRLELGTLDVDAVRLYLCGVEGLCREARTSNDLCVLLSALRVLRLAAVQIGEIAEGQEARP
jgi:hypothetical protein